jgi:uncharacterized protein involved in exopolysaccharide biosynthesis
MKDLLSATIDTLV